MAGMNRVRGGKSLYRRPNSGISLSTPRLPWTEMKAQVLDLCSENYISLRFIKSHQEIKAIIDDCLIMVRPIRSTIMYVTCLHELGHFLSKRSLTTKDDLASEAYAWQWAQRIAIIWTPVAERHKNKCLRLYLESLGKPKANHIFWRVYEK